MIDCLISKFYSSRGNESVVFDAAAGRLSRGQLNLITGPSGSGKTTFLKIISRDLNLDRGYIDYHGLEKQDLFLLDDHSLFDQLTIDENLEFISSFDAQIMNRLLEILEIKSVRHRPLRKLSKGQCSRFKVVYSLLQPAKVILLDEPLADLDSKSGQKLVEVLLELNKSKTLIIATHRTEYFIGIECTRLSIDDKKIIQESLLDDREDSSGEVSKNIRIRKATLLKAQKASLILSVFSVLLPLILLVIAVLGWPAEPAGQLLPDPIFSYEMIEVMRKDQKPISNSEISKFKKNFALQSIGLDLNQRGSYTLTSRSLRVAGFDRDFGEVIYNSRIPEEYNEIKIISGREPREASEIMVSSSLDQDIGSRWKATLSFDHFRSAVPLDLVIVGLFEERLIPEADRGSFIYVSELFYQSEAILDLGTDRPNLRYYLSDNYLESVKNFPAFNPQDPQVQELKICRDLLNDRFDEESIYRLDVFYNQVRLPYQIPVRLVGVDDQRVYFKNDQIGEFSESQSGALNPTYDSVPIRSNLAISFKDLRDVARFKRRYAKDYYIYSDISSLQTSSVDLAETSLFRTAPFSLTLLAFSLFFLGLIEPRLLKIMRPKRQLIGPEIQQKYDGLYHLTMFGLFVFGAIGLTAILLTHALIFGFAIGQALVILAILLTVLLSVGQARRARSCYS